MPPGLNVPFIPQAAFEAQPPGGGVATPDLEQRPRARSPSPVRASAPRVKARPTFDAYRATVRSKEQAAFYELMDIPFTPVSNLSSLPHTLGVAVRVAACYHVASYCRDKGWANVAVLGHARTSVETLVSMGLQATNYVTSATELVVAFELDKEFSYVEFSNAVSVSPHGVGMLGAFVLSGLGGPIFARGVDTDVAYGGWHRLNPRGLIFASVAGGTAFGYPDTEALLRALSLRCYVHFEKEFGTYRLFKVSYGSKPDSDVVSETAEMLDGKVNMALYDALNTFQFDPLDANSYAVVLAPSCFDVKPVPYDPEVRAQLVTSFGLTTTTTMNKVSVRAAVKQGLEKKGWGPFSHAFPEVFSKVEGGTVDAVLYKERVGEARRQLEIRGMHSKSLEQSRAAGGNSDPSLFRCNCIS